MKSLKKIINITEIALLYKLTFKLNKQVFLKIKHKDNILNTHI